MLGSAGLMPMNGQRDILMDIRESKRKKNREKKNLDWSTQPASREEKTSRWLPMPACSTRDSLKRQNLYIPISA